MDLYQEEIMDHYRNPRNRGKLENPDFTSGEYNPSCGDNVSIEGCVEDGRLVDAAFEGKGCVIGMATASILTESCKGKTLDEILAIDKDELCKLLGGMELGLTRLSCALLPLQALQQGIRDYKEKQGDKD